MDVLQFADDTSLVGEGSWKHVWAIRTVLRAFEMVSGLGINYHKSKLIGINTNPHFLEAVSHFLSCRLEESSFYFLGIPIGFNPRKEATWNPLFLKVRNRLEGWTNRFLNLGGRITLLKSVLSSICIFMMSFYKMPKKVELKFTSVLRKFLWGGMEERRHISWIKWRDVTLPLNKEGLGIKNLELFNLALLNKWRWRILQGKISLWLNMLKSHYGDISLKAFGADGQLKVSSLCSWWWKDILKIHSTSTFSPLSPHDPIVGGCKFIIHNGFHTPFWYAIWLDDTPLHETFPVLFGLSSLKNVSVAAMGGWRDGVWWWGDLGIPGFLEKDPVLSVLLSTLKGRLENFEG